MTAGDGRGMGAGSQAGRLCQALVARIGTGAAEDRLPANVELATATRLWTQDVPGGAGSAIAARRRDRELSRPVDPQAGPGVRVVLLRYADGLADLVVVAHRAVADPGSVLRAVLGAPEPVARLDADLDERLRAGLARLDRLDPPDWGLGRPGSDAMVSLPFTAPEGAGGPAGVALTAALGLALATCTGQQRVSIGVDPVLSVELDCAGRTTVADYLSGVRQALEHPVTGAAPLIGLTVTDQPGAGRPFLAPVHPLSIWVSDPAGRSDVHGGLRGGCWFRLGAFDPAVAHRLVRMIGVAHRNLAAADPRTPIGEVALFDAEDLLALAELGGLGRPLPAGDRCNAHQRICDAVRAHAERAPESVALCFEQQRLSYRELDERANRGAHALAAAGVRPGDRVGVCLERSLELVVMLLAVLKAGAAYVPMDAGYPADRLAYTATDAGLPVVITESADFPRLPGVRLLRPDALQSADWPATEPPATEPPAGCADDAADARCADAAYVIYTSGSTGRPKGVVVSHRNVLSLLAATRDEFAFGSSDVWTLFHSSAFDFSVWEIWGCLSTGGRLVVVPHWSARDPEQFAELLHAEQVSVLNQTPSAFSQLTEVDRRRPLPASLRLVIFGGEPLDTRPLRSWFDRHPEADCRLVNMFGITETTVHVTAQTLGRREALAGSRSVGPPLPGWHLSVLDPQGRPVPPGVSGEIYVGGAGVAAGYLNQPELTAQRFVEDPYAPGPRYRSGDRGRLLPDGRLEHLGRLDSQVKLRGFRIELDEIRARLLDAPGVAAAAVLLRQPTGDSASARLDGYVVFSGDGAVQQVREHAARFLPEHMVPSTLTALPALPLTPNGKLDQARLPEPLITSAAESAESAGVDGGLDGEPDAQDVEAKLRAVWQQVFGFRVGVDDDFFTLGGNSLLGVQLFAAMRTAGLPTPPLRQLYLNRTVRRLASVLTQS
ncbi:MAG TPA: amino acid adenylation domain-containing protein [Jatrophihabitans sp.]|uniref:amino acid adenylation domain-containing protein n=1 Tax=Jatrophihabitans sp. TaxID=1932789 RepID=UPI002F0B0821